MPSRRVSQETGLQAKAVGSGPSIHMRPGRAGGEGKVSPGLVTRPLIRGSTRVKGKSREHEKQIGSSEWMSNSAAQPAGAALFQEGRPRWRPLNSSAPEGPLIYLQKLAPLLDHRRACRTPDADGAEDRQQSGFPDSETLLVESYGAARSRPGGDLNPGARVLVSLVARGGDAWRCGVEERRLRPCDPLDRGRRHIIPG
ncbi:hypothetical protein NDU88_003003 [Pleurodeles waltl]|uniref:Uncharacterized protein n=1 Tax=Pleurodeles waltl TaxID=8319 RepID=A0AAV7M2P3_PLEWA|nr:hypothetical protein NDU88_003003 [Pleurodeles waltl]